MYFLKVKQQHLIIIRTVILLWHFLQGVMSPGGQVTSHGNSNIWAIVSSPHFEPQIISVLSLYKLAGLIMLFQHPESERIIFIDKPEPNFENQLYSKLEESINEMLGLGFQSTAVVRHLVSDLHARYEASLTPLWISWKEKNNRTTTQKNHHHALQNLVKTHDDIC